MRQDLLDRWTSARENGDCTCGFRELVAGKDVDPDALPLDPECEIHGYLAEQEPSPDVPD